MTGLPAADRGGAIVTQSKPVQHRGQPSAQDTGSALGHDQLATTFSELARTLEHSEDPEATLEQIVQAAVQLIPGVDEGSISVVLGRRRMTSQAPSGELARVVDGIQDEVGQGPCLDACYEHETVRVADLASETRWPEFSSRAVAAGAAGMLSFQLFVEGDDLGALNLYSRQAGGFDDDSEHVGLLFASHAAIAYAGARRQAGMVRSVATRQLIGQAEGILMERHKISGDQAFALLAKASQHHNVKLRDLAEQLVNSGVLPEGSAAVQQPEAPTPGS